MRRVLIFFAAVVSFPIVCWFLFIVGLMVWRLLVPFNLWASDDCSHIDRGSVMSPNASREAKVVYFSCGSPLTGYLRDVVVVAILMPGQSPSGSAIAMEVEEEEGQEWRLFPSDVAWQGANRLQVSVPKSVKVSHQKSRLDTVAIEIKRVPDKGSANTPP
jgi:hypothetical protein